MLLFERLRYALYLAVVVGAFVGLIIALASADVVGLLPISVFESTMSPAYGLVIYVVAFIVAPFVSPYFPITGWETASPDQRRGAKNVFAVRQMMLVIVGLLFVFIANLLVYILR